MSDSRAAEKSRVDTAVSCPYSTHSPVSKSRATTDPRSSVRVPSSAATHPTTGPRKSVLPSSAATNADSLFNTTKTGPAARYPAIWERPGPWLVPAAVIWSALTGTVCLSTRPQYWGAAPCDPRRRPAASRRRRTRHQRQPDVGSAGIPASRHQLGESPGRVPMIGTGDRSRGTSAIPAFAARSDDEGSHDRGDC